MEKNHRLDKTFAKTWVDSLRTTKLKQGFGSYHDKTNNCFCAMGVGLVANNIPLNKSGDMTEGDYDPIMDCIPINGGDSLWYTIYQLNDKMRLPFPEIADWIETNVEFI